MKEKVNPYSSILPEVIKVSVSQLNESLQTVTGGGRE